MTPKVFVWDIILIPVMIGFFTAAYHLLRYLSESITVDDNHVQIKTGILSNHETEIPLSKINSVSIRQGLFGKILGYGDIIISTGNDTNGIVFKNIDKPKDLKETLKK
jgi:uncharacterized membrane protein YdbT with pleckstrin-like domain